VTQLGKLTRRLESTLGRLLGTQPAESSEPLELVTGILRDVEQHVEPSGGGRRRFPFLNIGVIVLATRKIDQDRYAAALEDLDAKIRERLRELACDPPARLDVVVQYARKPRKHWTPEQRVELLFSRDAPAAGAPAAETASVPAVRLVIVKGTASKSTYSLEQLVIRVGRGDEHADASGRMRRNDVAFLDAADDEVNRTVARAQAHLRFDTARREFRLFDDGSSNGTRVVRNADAIAVTPHGPRGVGIVSGDILEFGRARLRFEIKS